MIVRHYKKIIKNNPNHDELGRFASSDSSGGGPSEEDLLESSRKMRNIYNDSVKEYTSGGTVWNLDAHDEIIAKVNDQLSEKLEDNEDFQKLVDVFRARNPDASTHDVVAALTKQWVVTSGDSSAPSVAIQLAAKKEFGLDDADIWFPENVVKDAKDRYGSVEDGLRALVREQHDQTQSYFEERGITHIDAYRGSCWDEGEGPDNTKFDAQTHTIEATGQPLSSFTVGPDTALSYANDNPFRRGDYRSIVHSRIPVKDIVSSPFTGFGTALSEEIVVKGKKRPCTSYGWISGEHETLNDGDKVFSIMGNHVKTKSRKESTKVVSLDNGIEQSDWSKNNWLLDDNKQELLAYLEFMDISVDTFMSMPVYQANKDKFPWLKELKDMKKITSQIKRENKRFLFQVKAIDDEQGLIEAYGSVFDNTDQGNDVVRPGAFKRTIQNSKARVQSGKSNFLAMMLWQHNENQPIGGWVDLQEDSHGLLCKGQIILNTQLGREAYELIKAGVINEFSIGYDIPSGGAYYDKSSGVRNLTELRLWEVSPVSFAMNQEALLVGVKAASGKTTWPLADRDTKWDAGQANKDIQKYAADGDNLNWSKVAQCFFWTAENPPTKLGDFKLAFVANVGGKMMAIPQGIISCAGVIMGAMGGADIDDVAGVKAKIATYYKKMDMTPPWENDDKSYGRHMNRKSKEKKTVQEHYAEEMCQDLLEDWQDVFICSLTCAVLDAFKIGDDPEQDISTALDDFKELVLTKFVPEAIECDLSGYLSDSSSCPADYTIQYGSDSQPNYGWMSSNRRREGKIGKPISSTNQQIIDAHVKSIKAFAKSAKAAMQDHANAMHDTADTVADLAGNNSKAGRAISAATAQSLNSAAEAMHDHADKALNIMNEHVKAVRTAADDFANTIQGAEPAYDGSDPGKPDDGQQEGKSNPATPSQQEARSPQTHSHKSTVDEDEREFELALASLVQELKCC